MQNCTPSIGLASGQCCGFPEAPEKAQTIHAQILCGLDTCQLKEQELLISSSGCIHPENFHPREAHGLEELSMKRMCHQTT